VEAAREVIDVARIAGTIGDQSNGNLVPEEGHVEHRCAITADGTELGETEASRCSRGSLIGIGFIGNETDDAAERTGAVERALWAHQHLDATHVVEIEVRVGRVVVESDITEILACRGLGRAVEAAVGGAADEQLVTAGTEIGRAEYREQLGDGACSARRVIGGPAPLERYDLDRARIGIEQHVLLACSDDDFLGLLDGLRGWRLCWLSRKWRRAFPDDPNGRAVVKQGLGASPAQGPIQRLLE
jgi:hypothetical protein